MMEGKKEVKKAVKKDKKVFKLSASSKRNIKGVDDRIIILVDRVLLKSPHDMGIPKYGGLRTPQEQNNLFHIRPSVTQIDGFKHKSYHQSGMAFDIYIYDEHKACWDCKHKYKEVADIFKAEFDLMQEEGIFDGQEAFEWGGDWIRFVDLPHFQIKLYLE